MITRLDAGRGERRWLAAIAAAGAVGVVAAAGSEALDPAALSAGSFTTAESSAHAFSLPIALLDAGWLAAVAAAIMPVRL